MLNQLLSSDAILKNWIAVVRIITGVIIAKYGLDILSGEKMKGDVAWLTDIHFPFPAFMAYLGKGAELVGGILLIAGLLTRLASMVLVINMSVIVFIMGKGNIWGDEQLPFLLLLLFVTFIICGGGKWSLDYVLFGRGKQTGGE